MGEAWRGGWERGGGTAELMCEPSVRSIYLHPCEASSSSLSFPHRLEFLPLVKSPNAFKTWPPLSFYSQVSFCTVSADFS